MLIKITNFCKQHKISHSSFGRLVSNDPRLVFDIRKGRVLSHRLTKLIEDFMENYQP